MKRFCLVFALAFFIPLVSEAGISKDVFEKFVSTYRPATWHEGLEYAYKNPDQSKLGGMVMVKRDGIPAQRAEYFLDWDKYDYRGVTIDGDSVKTRAGKIYAHLRTGTVMIVAGMEKFGNTLYFKLLSNDIYKPEGELGEKKCSRVSVKLGFRFPSDIVNSDDFNRMNSIVNSWIVPADGSKGYLPSSPVKKVVKPQAPKPVAAPKPKPIETPKPVATPKPVETAKPAEASKPVETTSPSGVKVLQPISPSSTEEYPDLAIEKPRGK